MATGSDAQRPSPRTANVFLHGFFGLWVQKLRSRDAGERYADEFVVRFQYHRQGERFLPPRAAVP
jgi:hypothetical protein